MNRIYFGIFPNRTMTFLFCCLRYLQKFVTLAKLMIILLRTSANSGKLGLQKRHKVSNVIIN